MSTKFWPPKLAAGSCPWLARRGAGMLKMHAVRGTDIFATPTNVHSRHHCETKSEQTQRDYKSAPVTTRLIKPAVYP
jgi:hypothetical protein